MRVDVVYALFAKQHVATVTVLEGSTIADAIIAAASMPGFPTIEVKAVTVGIFGKLANAETRLQEGDRVEIYRPLQVEPKQARQRRAGKKAGKTGKR
jgi:putative ubiquitin-RnfH superfamily antitoxin RatB of RatAB toxin-antitoxin module